MTEKFRFINTLLLFSAIIFLAGMALFSTVLSDHFVPVFYLFIPYFILLTLGGRLLVMNSNPGKPNDFNNRYFITRWAKVLLHLVILVVYLMISNGNIAAFVFTFLACYLLFSVFDIYTLGNYLKKK